MTFLGKLIRRLRELSRKLPVQAGRPEPELLSPQEKASVLVRACKPGAGEAEKEWSLGLIGHTV